VISGATISRLKCPAEDIEQGIRSPKMTCESPSRSHSAGKSTFCLIRMHVFDEVWKEDEL